MNSLERRPSSFDLNPSLRRSSPPSMPSSAMMTPKMMIKSTHHQPFLTTSSRASVSPSGQHGFYPTLHLKSPSSLSEGILSSSPTTMIQSKSSGSSSPSSQGKNNHSNLLRSSMSKICGVCGDRAKSYHFGGISCDSCKGEMTSVMMTIISLCLNFSRYILLFTI